MYKTYMASISDLYVSHHGFDESSLVTSTLGCFCSNSIHVPSPACRHMSCVTTFHVQHFILCNSKQSHVHLTKCVNCPLQEAHKLSNCQLSYTKTFVYTNNLDVFNICILMVRHIYQNTKSDFILTDVKIFISDTRFKISCGI